MPQINAAVMASAEAVEGLVAAPELQAALEQLPGLGVVGAALRAPGEYTALLALGIAVTFVVQGVPSYTIRLPSLAEPRIDITFHVDGEAEPKGAK